MHILDAFSGADLDGVGGGITASVINENLYQSQKKKTDTQPNPNV